MAPDIFEPEFDDGQDREGFSYKRSRIGRQAGGRKLGASVYEIEPGSAPFPNHWHEANARCWSCSPAAPRSGPLPVIVSWLPGTPD